MAELIKSKSFEFKNLEDYDEHTKKLSANDKFIFEENQTYIRKKDNKIISQGNYTIDILKKTIYCGDKKEPTYIIEYQIEKELLYLTMNHKSAIKTKSKYIYLKPTKYILKRINYRLESQNESNY